MMAVALDHIDVWVALLLPFSDGSGEAAVLGVYRTEEGAQARCWRETQALGYDQPTKVVEFRVNVDYMTEALAKAEA